MAFLLLLLLHGVLQHGLLLWLLPLLLHCLLPLLVPLPEAWVVLLQQALKLVLPTLQHSQHRWHMTAVCPTIAAALQTLAAVAGTTASAVDMKVWLLLLLLLHHFVFQSCIPLQSTYK
jgi:hypothetical protein